MPSTNNSKSDPWKSYLRYYFIEGHRTPSAPLNDFCLICSNDTGMPGSLILVHLNAVISFAENSGTPVQIHHEVLQIVRVVDEKHPCKRFFCAQKT